MASLDVNNLTVGYGHKAVLSNVSVHYESGQLVCITGDNGSGKSTLLRTIAGLQSPLGGEIVVNGSIGIVVTKRPAVDNLTAREVVSMGRAPYTGIFGHLSKQDWQIVDEAIQMIGIENLQDKNIGSMSDGEVQKVMIAKCLAQQTPIIIMDEPTAFLDFKSKKQLYQLMRRLVDEQHKLIIFSSHDLPLALEYATDEQSI